MKSKVIQTHNVKPQKPLCNGKNLTRKQNLSMFLPLGVLVLLVLFSILALTPLPTSAEDGNNNATDSASADIGVNVGLACTFGGDSTSHTVILNNGNYKDDIEGVILHTICNGNGNYTIQAIGYTDSNNDGAGEDGNNTMHLVGSSNTTYDIPTGTTLDGKVSNWAMKLSNNVDNTATIENGYSSFDVIPSTSTLVASYNATSSQTTDSTLQTTYGVSISPNQPAGTYTGQVKYTMDYTANPPYIQDYTLSQCRIWAKDGNVTVIDKRDGSDYTVRYINGACWMTQNLRITGTVSAKYSNFTGDDFNVSAGDLTEGNSYTEARSHLPNETDDASALALYSADQLGAWYNYCAASAGTICTNTASDATGDICPKGWHLPTGPFSMSDTDGYTIFQNTSYNSWIVVNDSLDAFGAVAGGSYTDGWHGGDEMFGYWWSATADAMRYYRFYLLYWSNGTRFLSANYNQGNGIYVRCVRTS